MLSEISAFVLSSGRCGAPAVGMQLHSGHASVGCRTHGQDVVFVTQRSAATAVAAAAVAVEPGRPVGGCAGTIRPEDLLWLTSDEVERAKVDLTKEMLAIAALSEECKELESVFDRLVDWTQRHNAVVKAMELERVRALSYGKSQAFCKELQDRGHAFEIRFRHLQKVAMEAYQKVEAGQAVVRAPALGFVSSTGTEDAVAERCSRAVQDSQAHARGLTPVRQQVPRANAMDGELELRQQEVGVEGGWHIGKAQGLGGVQEESSDDEAPVAEHQDICGG